jgi:hypothetical protein
MKKKQFKKSHTCAPQNAPPPLPPTLKVESVLHTIQYSSHWSNLTNFSLFTAHPLLNIQCMTTLHTQPRFFTLKTDSLLSATNRVSNMSTRTHYWRGFKSVRGSASVSANTRGGLRGGKFGRGGCFTRQFHPYRRGK